MPTSIEKLNTLIEYIAQSGFDCGVFQQRLQEIASEDPGIVNISSPKGSLLGAATKEMNIPAIKVLLECDAIKIDTVTDIIVGNTVTRAMPLHNVIYRLNQTAYSEIEPIVEIIDLFREKWAKSKAQDVGDAAKVTSKIAPLEYATKPEIKELLLLHGVKHKILKSDVQDPIKQLAQKLYDEPKTYLQITALHDDVQSQILKILGMTMQDLESRACDYIKTSGVMPKVFGKYTENAMKAFSAIAQELLDSPESLLHSFFDKEVYSIIEKNLQDKGSSFDTVKDNAYLKLKAGIDPKNQGGYTSYATELLKKLGSEMSQKDGYSLYLTQHENALSYLQDNQLPALLDIKNSAKKLLETGAKPTNNVDDRLTEHSKLLIAEISSDIIQNPMKFLHLLLDQISSKVISIFLRMNKLDVDIIKAQAIELLKTGESPESPNFDTLTPNALEVIKMLAVELIANKTGWLHIAKLHKATLAQLGSAQLLAEIKDSSSDEALNAKLAEYSSLVDYIKNEARAELEHGTNPMTATGIMPHSIELLRGINETLAKDPTQWIYLDLDSHAIDYLAGLGLNLDQIRAHATEQIKTGTTPMSPNGTISNETKMLISEITKSTSILLGFHTETLNYIASASQDSEIVESAKAAIDYAYTISHGGDDTVIPHKTTHVIHSQPAENSWGAMFVSWFVRAPEAVVDTRIEPQDNGLALLNAVADLHAKMPELVETNEFAVDDDRVIEVSEEVAGKLFTIATTGDVLPAGEAL